VPYRCAAALSGAETFETFTGGLFTLPAPGTTCDVAGV